jgi:hypothetical protein
VSLNYQQPDITVGEMSRANSNFSENRLEQGLDLDKIISMNKIEFLNSGVIANSGNAFVHSNTLQSGRVDVGTDIGADVDTTAHRFATTSSSGAVLGILSNLARDRIKLHYVRASSPAMLGNVEFLDASSPAQVRNVLGLAQSSPYDLIITSGLSIHGNVGFYGVGSTAKQTVTGSRGGNAALQSLLTALATIGLITDSTTAEPSPAETHMVRALRNVGRDRTTTVWTAAPEIEQIDSAGAPAAERQARASR